MENQTIDYRGFVILHRKITDNWIWLSEPFTKSQAWIDLILLANHTEGTFFKRGIKIEVKRGHVAWSEENLASRWKWSRNKVRNFIKLLKTEQQIEQHKSNILNTLEIKNYDSYQNVNNKRYDKKTPKGTTKRQQKDTNNKCIINDKECINNENNIYKQLAEGLKFILEEKLKRKLKSNSWEDEIRKLIQNDLKLRDDAIEDVKRTIQAIADNFGKEYFPIIQSGKSLREKFSKIEGYLQRNESKTKQHSDEQIVNNLMYKYENE